MDYMLKKYLPRIHFDSYEDFKTNYRVNVPADFNFGFDVVDGWAQEEPEKKALVWCNDSAEERIFTFQEISRISNQMCNYFRSIGIRKGDRILLILKRRYEYWITVTALHKIGAVVIPATFQLTEKDLIYRINAASVKMIICAQDENIISHVENSEQQCPSLQYKALIEERGAERAGWINYTDAYSGQSDVFTRPEGKDAVNADDLMLIYFTSGTTGMPKMVQHVQSYPLGHIGSR